MRRSPRVLLLWGAAILVAVVTAVVVAGDLATLHRRARSLGPERDAVVAAHALPVGTRLTSTDVEVVRRHESQLPDATVASVDAVEGRVVRVPVVAGGYVGQAHLAPKERTGLDGVVPPGMRAVRIVVEVAPPLEPGVGVDVLSTFDPSVATGGEPTITVAAGALVLAVDEGTDVSAGTGVTLLVDEADARRLAFAAATGIVTMAVVPPEEATAPDPEQ
jgi:Flp pilus assembly protein CpaB